MRMRILKSVKNEIFLYSGIYISGALGYGLIEILYRNRTHWSMMITGGACLLTFYFIERALPDSDILRKAILGTCVVTVYEFAVGCIVNLWFGLSVWDYNDQPVSLLGQVCPSCACMGFLLCLCLAWIYRFLYNVIS